MPKGKPLSVENRSAIVTLHQEGYSMRKISEKLKFKKSTVHLTIQRFKETDSFEDRNRPGPSRLTSRADDQQIKLLSKWNGKLSAPEIASDFNRGRINPISVSTVKRRLQEFDLHGHVVARKPLLRRGNSKKRLKEQQEPQPASLVIQEQDTSGPSFEIKEEITIDESVLEDLFIFPKIEKYENSSTDSADEDISLQVEIQTSQEIESGITPSIQSEVSSNLGKSYNKKMKISDEDSRVETHNFLNITPKLETFENTSEDVLVVTENYNFPNIQSQNLQETFTDNINTSPSTSHKSYGKKRKISDEDNRVKEVQDFMNTVQVKLESGSDHVDYAMHIASRLQNSNQSDHAIAVAKQKIDAILCDLEIGLFENLFI